MKKFIRKDFKLRKQYVHTFKKTFPYKILYKNQIIKKNIRTAAMVKYCMLSKSVFLTKVKNPCIITGRVRGILSFFKNFTFGVQTPG